MEGWLARRQQRAKCRRVRRAGGKSLWRPTVNPVSTAGRAGRPNRRPQIPGLHRAPCPLPPPALPCDGSSSPECMAGPPPHSPSHPLPPFTAAAAARSTPAAAVWPRPRPPRWTPLDIVWEIGMHPNDPKQALESQICDQTGGGPGHRGGHGGAPPVPPRPPTAPSVHPLNAPVASCPIPLEHIRTTNLDVKFAG